MKPFILTLLSFFVSLQAYSSFATVEGLRVEVTEIRLLDDYHNNSTTGYIGLGQTVDLAAEDASSSLTEGFDIALDTEGEGISFETIVMNFGSSVEIKAYAVVTESNYIKYTTTAGVGTLTNTTTWVEPGDYDFLEKSYLFRPDDSGEEGVDVWLSDDISLSIDDSPTLNVLIDIERSVFYFDGNADSGAPFLSEVSNQGETFSIADLPVIASLDQSLEVERYAFSGEELSDISKFDTYSNWAQATMTFDSSSQSFYQGQAMTFGNTYSAWGYPGINDPGWEMGLVIRAETNGSDGYHLNMSDYVGESDLHVINTLRAPLKTTPFQFIPRCFHN